MIYGSICSGIEAASVAWHPLGWRAAFLSEIDAFPRAVLAHHYPNVPLRGDFTEIQSGDHGSIDLLVGGTPCQDFSVAGLRKGLDGERGNLTLEFARLIGRLRPRWIVWENVPGVLSVNGGRAFGAFLGALGHLGYGFAYRVLDAQFFRIPQRRRRVFVVGYLGSGAPPVAVLFEPESLRGDSPPCREAGQSVAGALAGYSPGGGWRFGADEAAAGQLIAGALGASCGGADDNDARAMHLVAGTLDASAGRSRGAGTPPRMCVPVAFGGNNTSGSIDVATALNACGSASGRLDFESETFIAHTLRGEGFDASQDGTGRGTPLVPVAYRTTPNCGVYETGARTDALTTGTDRTATILSGLATGVRRLTPRECERLQGFPDDYTLIDWSKRASADKVARDVIRYFERTGYTGERLIQAALCPDGPRYKALGNSMAMPVMRWIGERIAIVDQLLKVGAAA